MTFTADQVWGLAVAADRINGGYFKEAYWERAAPKYEAVKIKEANKVMVKQWLAANDFSVMTDEDVEKGRECRNHIKGLLLKTLSGKISSFEKTALSISQMDTFTGSNLFEFSIISCLPAAMRREQDYIAYRRELLASVPLAGNVGDIVQGEVRVSSCTFDENYNRYRVTGMMGESFVNFWYKAELKGTHTIKGKIRNLRDDNATQLHYVKII